MSVEESVEKEEKALWTGRCVGDGGRQRDVS